MIKPLAVVVNGPPSLYDDRTRFGVGAKFPKRPETKVFTNE